MRFRFIAAHQDEFPVVRMCRVLQVSASGYYAWRKRPVSAREMANQQLGQEIKTVYENNHGTYGSPRVYRELRAAGTLCSKNRVARLMHSAGLRAKQNRRYRNTSRRNSGHAAAPNRLQRDFGASRPNHKWLADITYIPTGEGWLYLAAILDLYSRRIVGWAMSRRMTGDLTVSALQAALRNRQPHAGLIHHSDRGSQYTDRRYQKLLADHGIQASMNGTGTWYDNAPIESFFGTLKSELVYHRRYLTRAEARTDLFFYIEAFYNRRRRHSTLGYLSPEAFEQLYYQQHTRCLSPGPPN